MAKFKYGNIFQKYNNETISDTKILLNSDAQIQFLTPTGADRDVLLPAAEQCAGLIFYIINEDSINSINLKNSGGTLIQTIANGESTSVVCDGSEWQLAGNTGSGSGSGDSGYSGRSGTSGYSGVGTSGTSGYSGVQLWTRDATSGYVYPTTTTDMMIVGASTTPVSQSQIKSTSDSKVITSWSTNSATHSADVWQYLNGTSIWSFMTAYGDIHSDYYVRRSRDGTAETHWFHVAGTSMVDGSNNSPKFVVTGDTHDQELQVELNKIYTVKIPFYYEKITQVKLLLYCSGASESVTMTAGLKYYQKNSLATASCKVSSSTTASVGNDASNYQIISFNITDYDGSTDYIHDILYGVFGNVSDLKSSTIYVVAFGVEFTYAARTNP